MSALKPAPIQPALQPTELALAARLIAGDEAAFAEIVAAYSPLMLHVARGFVATRTSAEDVVQETWLQVSCSLEGFEGRSTLRTWVLAITRNVGRRHGAAEARELAWSQLDDGGGTVDPQRFRGSQDPWAGGWTTAGAPVAWSPEQLALDGEALTLMTRCLRELPLRQRTVVELRDVDGLDAGAVCDIFGISASNQRVLLHRGRAKLRQLLEDYYGGREAAP
ncbi:RNA polymerase sigma-70 factor (ECF subfamily) [Arthrobacter silviterrae]|uniref:RNA polymerase sigma factor n=1 Tax=Arthrobacter silviterrae TaxID=2026658 RepID=A0ABX0DBP5_9MICC|nr:RNA polymerase sigma factor [Arthrobacter silviterrae]MDQ0276025.1 RNA polymerase sigma-70 factor (ECF subfamily) [Arthrobacter silviterrae]NGN84342.1 RNA polymerase sigma factor [Arthrobacter silviterrae]